MKTHNELIDPFRQAGTDYIESFEGDDRAMLEDLRRRDQQSGRKIVSFPPKKASRPLAKSKPAN